MNITATVSDVVVASVPYWKAAVASLKVVRAPTQFQVRQGTML